MKNVGSKRNLIQVRNNNPQGSRLRGRPKSRGWNCTNRLLGQEKKLETGKWSSTQN